MKSLKLSSVYRSFFKRSYVQLSLLRPPEASAKWFKSHHEIAGNYPTANLLRYYCHSSINTSVAASTTSSQEHLFTFEPVVDVTEIPRLSDDELFKVISHLRDSVMNETNEELRKFSETPYVAAINEECVRRAQQNWDLDKAVDVVNMFAPRSKFLCRELLFWLLRIRFKKAMKSPVSTMMKYVDAMTKNNFWKSYHINWYHTECTLVRNLDHFDLPQISSLVNILNKRSAAVISQELIVNLYNRLMKEIDSVDSQVLNVFLFFFSHQRTVNIDCNSLIDSVFKRLSDENLSVNENLCLFCTKKKIHHLGILDHLAKHLIHQLPDIGVVELETIIAVLAFSNYESQDVYQKVINCSNMEPLRTKLLDHPKRLVKIISSLCLLGIYPYNHISLILSEEFLRNTYGKKLSHHNVPREVFILDSCVRVECPDYEGSKLDKKLEEELRNRCSSHIHHYLQTDGDTSIVVTRKAPGKVVEYTPSPHNKIILETRKILRELLGGSEYVHTCYVLPFLPRPDLLFGCDREKNAVKLPDRVLDSIHVDYQNLNEQVTWYVVTSACQHPTLKDDFIRYGKGVAKNRILKKRGFKVITIVEEVWFNLEEEQKTNYLSTLIR